MRHVGRQRAETAEIAADAERDRRIAGRRDEAAVDGHVERQPVRGLGEAEPRRDARAAEGARLADRGLVAQLALAREKRHRRGRDLEALHRAVLLLDDDVERALHARVQVRQRERARRHLRHVQHAAVLHHLDDRVGARDARDERRVAAHRRRQHPVVALHRDARHRERAEDVRIDVDLAERQRRANRRQRAIRVQLVEAERALRVHGAARASLRLIIAAKAPRAPVRADRAVRLHRIVLLRAAAERVVRVREHAIVEHRAVDAVAPALGRQVRRIGEFERGLRNRDLQAPFAFLITDRHAVERREIRAAAAHRARQVLDERLLQPELRDEFGRDARARALPVVVRDEFDRLQAEEHVVDLHVEQVCARQRVVRLRELRQVDVVPAVDAQERRIELRRPGMAAGGQHEHAEEGMSDSHAD